MMDLSIFEIIQNGVERNKEIFTIIAECGVCAFIGLAINLWLSKFQFNYLNNDTHRSVAFMLPPISYTIATAISSNLFLSLGLIGALSIIRYRTPVKNPFELAILFAYVTIGITAVVNIELFSGVIILIIIIPFINKTVYLFKKNRTVFNNNEINLATCKLLIDDINDIKKINIDTVRSITITPNKGGKYNTDIELIIKDIEQVNNLIIEIEQWGKLENFSVHSY